MAEYIPQEKTSDYWLNPRKNLNAVRFNSGYPISEDKMQSFQKKIQTNVLNNFRSQIKYPGIIRS